METQYRDQDAQGAMGQNYGNQELKQVEKERINPQNSDENQRLSKDHTSPETLRSGLYGRNGNSNPGPGSTKNGNDGNDEDDEDDDFSNEELDTDGADTDTESWIDDEEDEEDD